MKQLTERTQIAKAINFGKYQVLTIDLANEIVMCGEVIGYRGCNVRVKWQSRTTGETLYLHSTLDYYIEEQKLVISNWDACLKAGFGYSDLMEMVEFANAPILDTNQEVVLVVHNSRTKKALAPMIIKTSSRKDINSQEPLSFEEKNININII